MFDGFAGAAGQLQQATEIDVRIRQMRILRQRLGVGPKGRRRIAELELQRQVEQFPGVETLVLGAKVGRERLGRPCRGGLRSRSGEVDLELTRFRVPGGSAFVDQDAVPIRNDAHFAERPPAGEVPGEPTQGSADTAQRNPRLHELTGGAEKHQILKGEAVAVAGPALRSEEPRPSLGSNLSLGQAQQTGHIASGEGLHEPTIYDTLARWRTTPVPQPSSSWERLRTLRTSRELAWRATFRRCSRPSWPDWPSRHPSGR